MGRRKITSDKKKDKLSVTISKGSFDKFEELNISNKSKLINWLLEEHFNELNNGGM